MFPTFEEDERLPFKDRVLGLSFGEVARAYPVEVVTARRVINDQVGSQAALLVGVPGAGAVRAFDPQGNTFTPGKETREVVDQDGGVWLIEEDGLVSVDGSLRLPRLPARELFWFAWTAFFPHTELYR